jgi:hypothetical protein
VGRGGVEVKGVKGVIGRMTCHQTLAGTVKEDPSAYLPMGCFWPDSDKIATKIPKIIVM